jgi:ubiquinone/menaquinone biosynthesis C-methylase UbiE
VNLYDRLSRGYDRLAASERPLIAEGLRRLAPGPGERLLEIGSGTGWALASLARAVQPGGIALGLDRSRGMLEVARVRLAGAEARAGLGCADARCLPLAAASLDAIFISFTLELFPDPDWLQVLQECRRVLRSGGRLGVVGLLQVPQPGWMSRLYTWLHIRFPAALDCRPVPVEDWLTRAGFQISSLEQHSLWGLPVAIVMAQRG